MVPTEYLPGSLTYVRACETLVCDVWRLFEVGVHKVNGIFLRIYEKQSLLSMFWNNGGRVGMVAAMISVDVSRLPNTIKTVTESSIRSEPGEVPYGRACECAHRVGLILVPRFLIDRSLYKTKSLSLNSNYN